jgi:hypothetical protein
MRNLKSRLRELTESNEYRRSFDTLKKDIISFSRKKLSPSKILKFVIEKSKALESPQRTPPIYFLKRNTEKMRETGWYCVDQLSLKETAVILKVGNVNEHWIKIDNYYQDFKTQWELEYLFDPAQPVPGGFNPFNATVATLKYSSEELDPSRITIQQNLKYPAGVRKSHVKQLEKFHKSQHKIKDKRSERYSDDDLHEVKKWLQEGLNGIQIFRLKYPEHKTFNPMKDYVMGLPDEGTKKQWSKYQRTLRLIEAAKMKKP